MSTETNAEDKFTTRRSIGMFSGVFVASGVVIGSGIFISPHGVFGKFKTLACVGIKMLVMSCFLAAANYSVGVTLIIWVFGGLIAMLSTLCYCELATSIPESGSDYTYLTYAYHPALAFLIPWMNTLLPTADSILMLTFARYATEPFFVDSQPPEESVKLVAICLLLFITAINVLTNKLAVRLQVMWSYEGWNALCSVTEEVKNPGKTIPRATVVTIGLVTIVYLMINCAYFSVLSVDEMASSKIVALPFALKAMGGASWIVPLTVCLCTAGSYSAGILTFGRGSYVAARRGHFPQIFGMLHIHKRIPSTALALNCIAAIVLISIGQFSTLIDTFGFVNWTFKALSTLAVLIIRKRLPELNRPYKVPTIIPVFLIFLSLFFVVVPLINNPHFLYFYAIAFFAVGLLYYLLFVHKGYKIPGSERTTRFLQKLLQVAPCEWEKTN
uniref:b(0,+)-type amino acid transporter 1-like isoform X3 n=1 Tax=Ciona intestinalis TaxID=7719 RepID=UPI00089DC8FF|nr:b(0,+)-type amino acid transporter 1-like isoform X3 [Ciona intestinalis]|eukprot:XP_018669240.1 b(0,+)-type amino acid transporter 1-like isoform X3 [Ciona intestinalis]